MSDSSPLSTELRLQHSTGDEANIRNVPVAIMQALYHEITGRIESIEKRYEDSYIFRPEDIINLSEKLIQNTQQYNVSGIDIKIEVKFSTSEKQSFSSLERFRMMDIARKENSSSCIIIFSFLISTPGHGQYQNYKAILELNSYILRKGYSNLNYGLLGHDESINVKVEYVDYVVAQNMLYIIDNWISNLETINIKRPPKWLDELDEVGDPVFGSIGFAACMLIMFGLFINSSIEINSINIVGFIYLSITLSVFIGSISLVFGRIAQYKIWLRGRYPYLILTKGDEQNYDKFNLERNQKLGKWKAACIAFAVAIVTGVISGAILSYLGISAE